MPGCELHTAYVFDRGGARRIAQIPEMTSITWGRVADDVSMCDITVDNPTQGCAEVLNQMEPGRHEIVVFRGAERVWEGPLTLLTYERETVSIQARDVMHYPYRLAQSQDYDNSFPNVDTVVNRAMWQLVSELTRRETEDPPINVVPFLIAIHRDDDARTSRSTTAYQKTIFDDIDDLAANSGLDYTVVGRSIIVHDTNTALGKLATLTENDIVGDIMVTSYGLELATFAAVSGAEGQFGIYGGTDPYYGRIEIVDDAYDETAGTDAPTQTELDSQARRNLSGRNPTPTLVRIPDGSKLNPNSPYDINDLVPGVVIPLRATLTARTFSQLQKLREMRVHEAADTGEEVTITLVTAPAQMNFEPARAIGAAEIIEEIAAWRGLYRGTHWHDEGAS